MSDKVWISDFAIARCIYDTILKIRKYERKTEGMYKNNFFKYLCICVDGERDPRVEKETE